MAKQNGITATINCSVTKINVAEQICTLLESHPGGFGLELEEYALILNGEGLFFFQEWINEGEYLENFLITANWWLKVARLVTEEMYAHSASDEADDMYREINGIFAMFGTAWRMFAYVDAVGSDPTGLDMIRRYCLVRQNLCKYVLRQFRDVPADRFRTAL